MTVREVILNHVNTAQGLKAVDLVMKCLGTMGPSNFISSDEFMFELAKLVSEGEIIEVEYILPQMDYRLKSLYFPKGTKVYVNFQDEAKAKHSNNAQGNSV